jgi:hypothetical protein
MTETSGPRQIIIGCDHAAYRLKETLKKAMEAQGIAVIDVGTHSEDIHGLSGHRQDRGRKDLLGRS